MWPAAYPRSSAAQIYAFTAAIATGLVICTVGVLFFPGDFTWQSLWDARNNDSADAKELEEIENDSRYNASSLRKWTILAGISSGTIFGASRTCLHLLLLR